MSFATFLSRSRRVEIPAPAELLVPDDRVALLLGNDQVLGLHPPGRLVLPEGNVEVRLIASLAADGDALAALDLPFERSLLFADGELVAMVKPAQASPGAKGRSGAREPAAAGHAAPANRRRESPRSCAPEARLCVLESSE